ncbi:MAG: pentapeptide repeat-containing protein [Acidobacteria bacterium]|nr:pentapeptide repeat-containing protein [Acidobacteriota bacterium]
MPASPSTKVSIAAAFVCDCDKRVRTACKGFPFFKEHEGKQYCVLHYPGKEKTLAFKEALDKKIKAEEFNFSGVWFPDALDLSSAKFSAGACFKYATFSEKADFSRVEFGAQADFSRTTFRAEAHFKHTTFSAKADFHGIVFTMEAVFFTAVFMAEVDFNRAVFSTEADFRLATFSSEANFRTATFKDYVRFAGGSKHEVFGDNSSLNLQFARFEKPERVSFHTVKLRPHWFVNVDPRKFEFTSVGWHWYNHHWYNLKIRGKLKRQLREKAIPSYILLAVACRRLAVNAEENNLYWRASSFRYLAMNVERLDTGRGFAFWKVDWWYWLASGFGERAGRAFSVLIGVLVLFAALYVGLGYPNWGTRVAPEKAAAAAPLKEVTAWQQWSSALVYSAGVMTLQKPEPKPATNAAQAVVMLETVLGPVQAALLALAIRRKFMR